MSTKSMKADGKSSETENKAVKSGHTSESWQNQDTSAAPKPADGKENTSVMTVMTAEEVSNLLARLQDILSLWSGSDNKIIGNYVMTAFPIPQGLEIGRMKKKNGHDNVFCVNKEPVSSLD